MLAAVAGLLKAVYAWLKFKETVSQRAGWGIILSSSSFQVSSRDKAVNR